MKELSESICSFNAILGIEGRSKTKSRCPGLFQGYSCLEEGVKKQETDLKAHSPQIPGLDTK